MKGAARVVSKEISKIPLEKKHLHVTQRARYIELLLTSVLNATQYS